MRKLLRICCISIGAGLISLSAMAANFYQNNAGEIIMELTSQQDAQRLLAFGEELPLVASDVEKEQNTTPLTFSEQNFDVAQAKLIAFVREVNWKTGFNLTMRDTNFFQRLKMVFTGINLYTQPMRMNLTTMYPEIENQLVDLEDELLGALQEYATASAFDKAVKLSLLGLRYAILTDKPFILLFLDEGQYNELIALDKRLHPDEDSAIETLINNLYTFFTYRAVYMDNDYNANTEKLIKVAKMGDGDAPHTWEKFAEFSALMYTYDADKHLTPTEEANMHIPRLEFAMRRVKHNLEVEKKAAHIAYKDPANADIIKELNEEDPKEPTLEQEARKLLQRSTKAQIKEMIFKHCYN